MKALNELLDMARQHAALTGDGAKELVSGVIEAEAHVAAWHAVAVQGGFSTPVREAYRLSADKGFTDRHILTDQAMMGELDDGRQVDFELVARCIGAAEMGAALLGQLPKAPAVAPGTFLEAGQRGEWVDGKGKTYHRTADGSEHVGTWLTCDGCNPVQVVQASNASGLLIQQELVSLRAEHYAAEQEAKAATERLKAVKGKLQAKLSEATNGALRSALHVPGYKPVTLTYGERWTVDSKRLKAEQPVIYAGYAKLGSSWTLQESRGGQ